MKSRIKVVSELRESVKNHDLAKDSRILLPLSPEWPAIEDRTWKYNLMPFKVLEKVGFKV